MDRAALIDVIERGSGLIIGTATADGEPRATRAWAATLSSDGLRVRTVVTADDPMVIEGLRNGRVALTAADVRTLRAVQLKGRVVLVEALRPEDVELMDMQTEKFFTAINETDGNPIEQLRRMLPHQVLAVEFEVDERFDQTPGPKAGGALEVRS